jgi:hypothetical protein
MFIELESVFWSRIILIELQRGAASVVTATAPN